MVKTSPLIGRASRRLKISVSPSTVTTNNGTSTVSKTAGPNGTPTWSWVRTSGSTQIQVTNATSATATFSVLSFGSFSAVFTVTATLAGQTATATVTANITASALSIFIFGDPATGTINSHTAGSVTSSPLSASVSGGNPGYSYAWSIAGGGISITNPTSSATSFTNGSVGTQTTFSGTATCIVTDAASNTSASSASVSLSNVGWPLLSASGGGSATGTVNNAGTVTVTTNGVSAVPSGGQTPYSYSWSAGGSYTVNSPSSSSTTFSQALGPGASSSGTSVCTITSTDGQSTTVSASVSLSNTGSSYIAVTADVDDTNPLGNGPNGSTTIQTTAVTATGHNGTGSYTYSWARLSGSTAIVADSGSSRTTTFSSTGQPSNSERVTNFRCTVSDGTTSGTADVTADIVKGTAP